MKRRDFLKGGTLLAACLVAGLKPTEPEIIKSPGGDFLAWQGHDREQIARAFRMPPYAIYGGMAGGGKTPDTWATFVRDIYDNSLYKADLLEAVERAA